MEPRNTESEQTPPPTLDYTRDERRFLHRYRRQIRLGLIIGIALFLTAWFGPRALRHASLLYAQSRLASYIAPDDRPVYREVEVKPSVALPPGGKEDRITADTPRPWERIVSDPPFFNSASFFLGPLRPSSSERLVHASILGSYYVLPQPGPTPEARCAIVIDVYDPATLTQGVRRTRRNTGLGFGVPSTRTLSVYAGRPDAANPACFIFRYASDVGSGTIRATLDASDAVKLEVLDGPAILISTRPAIGFPP
ncbi:MAG TPA: hypothetical protein VH475_05200 [Tepidisphaeraceae bacterium]|jgi:hypothetical protein